MYFRSKDAARLLCFHFGLNGLSLGADTLRDVHHAEGACPLVIPYHEGQVLAGKLNTDNVVRSVTSSGSILIPLPRNSKNDLV